MLNLKQRIAILLLLIAASVWSLWPREVTERVRQPDGTFALEKVDRVPLKLGLDLKGGMHLALEVDESKGAVANPSEAIDRALKVVRTRIDEFGVAEPVVQKVGEDRIIVELPGVDDPERARAVVERSAFLQFQITDETQALEKVLPRLDALARETPIGEVARAAPAAQPARPAQGGVQELFAPGADTAARADTAGTDTAAVAAETASVLPIGQGSGPVSSLIQPGSAPGEYVVLSTEMRRLETFFERQAVQDVLPPGKEILWSTDSAVVGGQVYRSFYVVDERPIITGEYLVDAAPSQTPLEGTVVQFRFNNEGGRRFRNQTGRHVGDYMAIVLDDRVMGRPPVIQEAIGARGQITLGGQDLQAAQDLALVLRAGALPVPLRVEEIRTIGPSLGRDSIQAGIRASGLAIALVVLIMLVYYRFSGVLAVGALALYVLYTLAVLAGFGGVLTLPGLAGFVLSIGIAVDANVLIFERIREELDQGKTVRTAIDEGFRHAMSAIVDSNVTTALTATVLYQFGTGPVQGFAVTLLAGIAASMITAIFVTRTFFLLWLNRTRGAQTLSI